MQLIFWAVCECLRCLVVYLTTQKEGKFAHRWVIEGNQVSDLLQKIILRISIIYSTT